MGELRDVGKIRLRVTFSEKPRIVTIIGAPRAKTTTATHAPRFLN